MPYIFLMCFFFYNQVFGKFQLINVPCRLRDARRGWGSSISLEVVDTSKNDHVLWVLSFFNWLSKLGKQYARSHGQILGRKGVFICRKGVFICRKGVFICLECSDLKKIPIWQFSGSDRGQGTRGPKGRVWFRKFGWSGRKSSKTHHQLIKTIAFRDLFSGFQRAIGNKVNTCLARIRWTRWFFAPWRRYQTLSENGDPFAIEPGAWNSMILLITVYTCIYIYIYIYTCNYEIFTVVYYSIIRNMCVILCIILHFLFHLFSKDGDVNVKCQFQAARCSCPQKFGRLGIFFRDTQSLVSSGRNASPLSWIVTNHDTSCNASEDLYRHIFIVVLIQMCWLMFGSMVPLTQAPSRMERADVGTLWTCGFQQWSRCFFPSAKKLAKPSCLVVFQRLSSLEARWRLGTT